MLHSRTLRSVDELVASAVAVRAGLTRPKVTTVVLYTGPMVRASWHDIVMSTSRTSGSVYVSKNTFLETYFSFLEMVEVHL